MGLWRALLYINILWWVFDFFSLVDLDLRGMRSLSFLASLYLSVPALHSHLWTTYWIFIREYNRLWVRLRLLVPRCPLRIETFTSRVGVEIPGPESSLRLNAIFATQMVMCKGVRGHDIWYIWTLNLGLDGGRLALLLNFQIFMLTTCNFDCLFQCYNWRFGSL